MMPEHAAWRAMRAAARDPGVTKAKLAPGTVKRALSFARPHKRRLFFFSGFVLANALAGAATPLLYRAVINDGIGVHPPESSHPTLILVLAVGIGVLALLSAGLSLAQRLTSARIGEGLIFDLRSAVFKHVQSLPLSFFTQTQTGALVSRIDNDVLGAQQAFTSVLSNLVGSGVTVLVTLGAMFFLSWQITLVCLALLPLLLFSSRFVGHKLQRITRESYNLNASLTAMATERFDAAGALLAKVFGHPQKEEADFKSKAARVRDIGVTQALYSQSFLVTLTLIASLATALVYGLGGHLAAIGVMSVGTIVALASYLTRLFTPLTALSNAPVTVMSALVSFERVFEVLDLPVEAPERKDAHPLHIGKDGIGVEFDHVWFRYPTPKDSTVASLTPHQSFEEGLPKGRSLNGEERPFVLTDVSLVVEPGSLVALVGPSGAGKSTLSQLVARLYDATKGRVLVGGDDVRDLELSSLRNAIGMVPQDPHLFHDSVAANLLYARPDASEEELWEALEAAQLAHVVSALPNGLATLVGDRGYRLSGGEKQRLALARVFLKRPSIVLLDEATSHLDSESERAVQEALSNVLEGRTSLVIAHRLSTVLSADLIAVVEAGRIVEQGRHHELVEHGGLYAELYQTQFAAVEDDVGAETTAAGLL
ncbi:MAG: ABC transporter ATP-binding protein/permease [Actinobacteria bacterium]|nr:ABC transporter ATP-binding protein/permease [Actinomycetota bacterium]MCL6094741.1 ABC transporter ATP-binding protein/permease [Actinomycetota bacterium]